MKNAAAFFLLALPFGAAAIVAALVAPLAAWFYGSSSYAKNLLRAMDKLGAALLGGSGLYTVSAECGASTCRACALLCRMLDWIQKGHCEGAALREGTKKP